MKGLWSQVEELQAKYDKAKRLNAQLKSQLKGGQSKEHDTFLSFLSAACVSRRTNSWQAHSVKAEASFNSSCSNLPITVLRVRGHTRTFNCDSRRFTFNTTQATFPYPAQVCPPSLLLLMLIRLLFAVSVPRQQRMDGSSARDLMAWVVPAMLSTPHIATCDQVCGIPDSTPGDA